jgi:hypothetical protein
MSAAMAWLRKKTDPISDRARALNDEIAQLESQIKKLDTRLQKEQTQPKLRSNAMPHGEIASHNQARVDASLPPLEKDEEEVILEQADIRKLEKEDASTPEHFNELGVRKYDLPAMLKKVQNNFQAPATTNPKLVSYLAAGGIQGMRPLRYEKRVARNRFILLVVVLFLTLLGILAVFLHQR